MQFLHKLFIIIVALTVSRLLAGIGGSGGVQASKLKPLLCTLPYSVDGYKHPTPWRCNGQLPLWSYDCQRNECVQFRYGGCGGNDNSFFTREQCEVTCRG